MYDKRVLEVFLRDQRQLFPENVAENEEEAAEFLDELCAVVARNKKEVREYLDDVMDIAGMDEKSLLEAEEVFDLGDGRYLIVEG